MTFHAVLGLVTLLAAAESPALRVEPASVRLVGSGATYSLLVDTPGSEGAVTDQTHLARYTSSDPRIVTVSPRGVLMAVADGKARVKVAFGKREANVEVEVRGTQQPRDYHFAHDILPILSRYSCNASGCHGKAEGQNGFKLSVFGFDAVADYQSLLMEGRGRRLLPASPASSLLVRKMAGLMPHGGGAKIRPGMPAYDTVVGWIAAGAPFGASDAPELTAVVVSPAERVVGMQGKQQLRVLATYSDGRQLDVTSQARFQSNSESIAAVDAEGLVSTGEVPGEAAVMASYRNVFGVSRVFVPRREKVTHYPTLAEHNFIDKHVHNRLRKLRIVPAEVCDDATYLRRVYLDLIGTLPTAAEARAFLGDRRENRRAALIDALLQRPEFADYWAMKWADLLRVDRAALGSKQARAYHAWIRKQIAGGTRLDQMAREVLTADGPIADAPQGNFYRAVRKPGEVSSTLAQVFLGVRIGCAECHHHPFDRWSQDDYHGLAAYFQGIRVGGSGRAGSSEEELTVSGQAAATNPRTGRAIPAHPLGAALPVRTETGDQRESLARWLTSSTNPYFARNIANRVWAHLLGRGLVEPVDDVRATNPPSNPDLLDGLAQHLMASKYDLRSLLRVIVASRTYQLATAPNETNRSDAINYSRGMLRRVPAEVLLDMVSQTTGVAERFRGAVPGTRAIGLWDSKVPHYFLRAFGRPERTSGCECDRNPEPSVAQVLHLLNAPEIEAKLSHAGSNLTRWVKKLSDDKLVEELYFTFFSRPPTAKERKAALAHLKDRGAERREAVEDLAWGMLNSIEFVFNH